MPLTPPPPVISQRRDCLVVALQGKLPEEITKLLARLEQCVLWMQPSDKLRPLPQYPWYFLCTEDVSTYIYTQICGSTCIFISILSHICVSSRFIFCKNLHEKLLFFPPLFLAAGTIWEPQKKIDFLLS